MPDTEVVKEARHKVVCPHLRCRRGQGWGSMKAAQMLSGFARVALKLRDSVVLWHALCWYFAGTLIVLPNLTVPR